MKTLRILIYAIIALVILSTFACSPVVYAHTENDITVSGKKFEKHHVETISLPKSKTI
jgi:hypothetical protein